MTSKLVTYGLLFFSFAFGVIGLGVGINAAVKSNDMKDYVRDNVPTGVTVDIDTSEAWDPGAVLTVGSGLLALTSFLTFVAYISIFKPVSRRPVLFAALAHWFWAVWIFATLVAYDVIAVNRDAKIVAFLGNTQLPDSAVRQQEQALGVSRVYWDHDYIRFLAIIPWFAFLFAVLVGVERFIASKNFEPARSARTAAVDAAAAAESGAAQEVRDDDAKEKPSVEQRESTEKH